MRVMFLILSLSTVGALADDLPANLLLKCEGKLTIILTPPVDMQPVRKFETTLRLKDGVLADTESMYLTTSNCQLRTGVVSCSAQSVSSIGKGSERRSLKAYITRETGEYDLFLETWSFDGGNATGKQTSNMKYRRAGVCQIIGKPIF